MTTALCDGGSWTLHTNESQVAVRIYVVDSNAVKNNGLVQQITSNHTVTLPGASKSEPTLDYIEPDYNLLFSSSEADVSGASAEGDAYDFRFQLRGFDGASALPSQQPLTFGVSASGRVQWQRSNGDAPFVTCVEGEAGVTASRCGRYDGRIPPAHAL